MEEVKANCECEGGKKFEKDSATNSLVNIVMRESIMTRGTRMMKRKSATTMYRNLVATSRNSSS